MYLKRSSDEPPTVLGRDVCDPGGAIRRAGNICGSGTNIDNELLRAKAREGLGFVERSSSDHGVYKDAGDDFSLGGRIE